VIGDRRKLPHLARRAIERLIAADDYAAGARLPGHSDLARRLGVARATVREALTMLEADGLVEIRHGSGTYVSTLTRVSRPITRLEGMSEFLVSQGFTVTDRVLGSSVREASIAEHDAFGLAPGEEVLALERARLQGDELLIYSGLAIPCGILRQPWNEIDWSRPLLGVLDEMGIHVAGALSEIRAAPLPPRVARRLRVPRSLPFILLSQRVFDDARRAVLLADDYYRGSHFSFSVVRRRDA
jgi:GntR family transcriptional regulator